MHSGKVGSLVCAITVHLLLVLFEGHACVRVCVPTCACDLNSKRGASVTNLKTSIGRARLE